MNSVLVCARAWLMAQVQTKDHDWVKQLCAVSQRDVGHGQRIPEQAARFTLDSGSSSVPDGVHVVVTTTRSYPRVQGLLSKE